MGPRGTAFSSPGSYGKLRRVRCSVGVFGRSHPERPWSRSAQAEMINHPWVHPIASEWGRVATRRPGSQGTKGSRTTAARSGSTGSSSSCSRILAPSPPR